MPIVTQERGIWHYKSFVFMFRTSYRSCTFEICWASVVRLWKGAFMIVLIRCATLWQRYLKSLAVLLQSWRRRAHAEFVCCTTWIRLKLWFRTDSTRPTAAVTKFPRWPWNVSCSLYVLVLLCFTTSCYIHIHAAVVEKPFILISFLSLLCFQDKELQD